MTVNKEKLRVGLLLDGMELEAWTYRMIEIIRASDYAEVCLVVINDASEKQSLAPTLANETTLGKALSNATRKILRALEQILVGGSGKLPNACLPLDGRNLLADVDSIRVSPGIQSVSRHIEGDELSAIQARNIDVFIRLGSPTLSGGILRSARYGVWSYHQGDYRINRGGPSGYWEVMESWPETGCVLQVLTEEPDNGKGLFRSFSSTIDMSLQDNKSRSYWKTLHFIPRKLRQLHARGSEEFFARVNAESKDLQFYDRRLYSAPSNGERSALLWKKLLQKVVMKYDELRYFNQWILLYDIQKDISTSLCRFRRIAPPKDRMWADPFIVARDNMYYVFIEEMLFVENKGHISLIVMNKDGSIEPPVTVLETPYHLSYPFLFEFENSLYMIPESGANRTIDVFKCLEFPTKWKYEKNLMKGCAAFDSTLLHWQGKWWLFAVVVETEGASSWDELFLYHSDHPISDDWTPHMKNPIVSDVALARPAGRIFVRNGRLYRPSQNSSRRYGYGFNICEITNLTETDYEERVVSAVEPKWDKDIIGTHTMNYEDGLTIIDGLLRRRK